MQIKSVEYKEIAYLVLRGQSRLIQNLRKQMCILPAEGFSSKHKL